MPEAMKHPRLLLTLFAAVLAANLVVGYRVYCSDDVHSGEERALEKIAVMMRVLHLIRQDYVDGEATDYESLLDNALHGMVESLDPHSSYLAADDYEDMMDATEGHFGGLGVLVGIRDGALVIIAPMAGTPGEKAGLLAGDLIVKIDGVTTDNERMSESIRRLKGDPGTSVTLTIARKELPHFEVTITRATIEVPSVKNAAIVRDGIGYVRLTQFDEKTAPALKTALADLEKQGMKALIVDLRNNPGGLLHSAVEVCSLFLPKGKMVVSTEGRRPSQKEVLETSGGKKFDHLPLAILINGGSASASEIMAGCLQDWQRAMLVGEKSFGKGSVQSVIPLPDGSALRLTVAKYYTPSRRVIHGQGIEPDIRVELDEQAIKTLMERQIAGNGLASAEPDGDPQLARALETMESYEVYRGKNLRAPAAPAPPSPPATSPENDEDRK